MNLFPGKLKGRLASPFLLVHGVGHDERTWILLFSLCYFHHEKDGNLKRSNIKLTPWMASSSAILLHQMPF